MAPNDDARPADGRATPRTARPRVTFTEKQSQQRHFVDLYNPSELRRLLPAPSQSCDGFEIGGAEPRRISDDQHGWEAKIREIHDDPRGPSRHLLVAGAQILQRLSALRAKCPGCEAVVDLILRAAHLSAVTNSPLRLPPLLLVGPAGVGKTHFARQLASALGLPLDFIAGDLLTDRGTITGLSLSWRAARPGRVATTLLESALACPIFVIDEVDKVSAIHPHENPLAFLHTILEPENARKFRDEYLSFPMRADHCVWILTANRADALAPSILDRLLVVPIKEPDVAAMIAIGRAIYQSANDQHGGWFTDEPGEDFLAALAHQSPRAAAKIVEFAMGHAAMDRRHRLAAKDVIASVAILEAYEGARGRPGFLLLR